MPRARKADTTSGEVIPIKPHLARRRAKRSAEEDDMQRIFLTACRERPADVLAALRVVLGSDGVPLDVVQALERRAGSPFREPSGPPPKEPPLWIRIKPPKPPRRPKPSARH